MNVILIYGAIPTMKENSLSFSFPDLKYEIRLRKRMLCRLRNCVTCNYTLDNSYTNLSYRQHLVVWLRISQNKLKWPAPPAETRIPSRGVLKHLNWT
jgi:hypothetical protein